MIMLPTRTTSWLCGVLLLLLITTNCGAPYAGDDKGQHLNQFVIQLTSGDREVAEEVARHHGFILKREIPSINAFMLEHPNVNHRSKRSAENELQLLISDKRVKHAQQEVVLHRVKRTIVHDKQLELPIREIVDDSKYLRQELPSMIQRDNVYTTSVKFSDPKFKDMWYLVNQGQSGGEQGLDMNVAVVWENGFSGKGVVVCILDDGVDHTHSDLVDNYDPDASTDLNDRSDKLDDPMPDTSDEGNSHGTRCAGEIAASANNHVCGVGIAYEARIGGVRVLDGTVTDALEAEAITFNNNYIDIYSASWGPNDDGATMEGPRHMCLHALKEGVRKGRNGLGSIFVWATGNGGMNHDDCSADGYVSQPETLSVGSVNDWGKSPFFMENCTSTLAVVPSGGEDYQGQEEDEGHIKLKVVTTDMNGGCIENFQGTSSAAPLAAGCLANVLQANPGLSWRDVQHIVVRGTRIPSVDNSWTINGAGHHVSHRFGFGLMDCGKMVELAQSWENFPEQRACNTTKKNYQTLKSHGKIKDTMIIDGCKDHDSDAIDRLEHVQVYVKMSTHRRGDTLISLTSPAGTRSILLSPRKKDDFKGDWEFTFMTVHSWDESPLGQWVLEIYDMPFTDSSSSSESHGHSSNSDESSVNIDADLLQKLQGSDRLKYLEQILDEPVGYIKEWSILLLGTHGTRHDRTDIEANRHQEAFRPTEEIVSQIRKREFQLSQTVNVKRAEPEGMKEKENSVDEEDELVEKLWYLLHSHGAREVRKRVFGSSQPLRISNRNVKNSDHNLELEKLQTLTREIKSLLEENTRSIHTRKRKT